MKLLKNNICIYCGDYSEAQDHILPKSIFLISKFTVPACKECNGYLRDIIFETFIARCLYINKKYTEKYLNSMIYSHESPYGSKYHRRIFYVLSEEFEKRYFELRRNVFRKTQLEAYWKLFEPFIEERYIDGELPLSSKLLMQK